MIMTDINNNYFIVSLPCIAIICTKFIEDDSFSTVLATARLKKFQYESTLLSSTILYRFGNSVRFSQARLVTV